ncbi:hypothetical protein [Occultella gossypii]|uniref:DUF3168 domain-containing protein n=1 Tax=Occultella gossypii TaxID=2800820 RepID=A0ABS7SAH7_9MICO|nr:hypothetical protein [Occultella gossypii]MBZ2197272.1 hypothetical protein [Occultella gossypii]
MNAVTAAANALADALTAAGLKTYGEVPEKASAPFRYVLIGGVVTGQSLGSWLAVLRVVCVAKPGTNAVTSERVMDMAVGVINATADLDGYEVAADAVDEPAEFQINGQPTLAAAVNVTARLSRAQMKG